MLSSLRDPAVSSTAAAQGQNFGQEQPARSNHSSGNSSRGTPVRPPRPPPPKRASSQKPTPTSSSSSIEHFSSVTTTSTFHEQHERLHQTFLQESTQCTEQYHATNQNTNQIVPKLDLHYDQSINPFKKHAQPQSPHRLPPPVPPSPQTEKYHFANARVLNTPPAHSGLSVPSRPAGPPPPPPTHNTTPPVSPTTMQRDHQEVTQIVVILPKRQPQGHDSSGLGFAIRGANPVTVTEVTQSGEAYRKGVRTGDQIIKINGASVSSLDHKQVGSRIRHSREQIVLTLLRVTATSSTSSIPNVASLPGSPAPGSMFIDQQATSSAHNLSLDMPNKDHVDTDRVRSNSGPEIASISPNGTSQTMRMHTGRRGRDHVIRKGMAHVEQGSRRTTHNGFPSQQSPARLRNNRGRRATDDSNTISAPTMSLQNRGMAREEKKRSLEEAKVRLMAEIDKYKTEYEKSDDMENVGRELRRKIKTTEASLKAILKELFELSQLPPEVIEEEPEDEADYPSHTLPAGYTVNLNNYPEPRKPLNQQEQESLTPDQQAALIKSRLSPSEQTPITTAVTDTETPLTDPLRSFDFKPSSLSTVSTPPSSTRNEFYLSLSSAKEVFKMRVINFAKDQLKFHEFIHYVVLQRKRETFSDGRSQFIRSKGVGELMYFLATEKVREKFDPEQSELFLRQNFQLINDDGTVAIQELGILGDPSMTGASMYGRETNALQRVRSEPPVISPIESDPEDRSSLGEVEQTHAIDVTRSLSTIKPAFQVKKNLYQVLDQLVIEFSTEHTVAKSSDLNLVLKAKEQKWSKLGYSKRQYDIVKAVVGMLVKKRGMTKKQMWRKFTRPIEVAFEGLKTDINHRLEPSDSSMADHQRIEHSTSDTEARPGELRAASTTTLNSASGAVDEKDEDDDEEHVVDVMSTSAHNHSGLDDQNDIFGDASGGHDSGPLPARTSTEFDFGDLLSRYEELNYDNTTDLWNHTHRKYLDENYASDKQRSVIRLQEVINEFIHTERCHLKKLRTLESVYFELLRSTRSVDSNKFNENVPKLEKLLSAHTMLTNALVERQKMQAEVAEIGDVIETWMLDPIFPMFKDQSIDFCIKQQRATEYIQDIVDDSSELQREMQMREQSPLCNRLSCSDYLACQFQRLTKYPLLLSEIIKYTNCEEQKVRLQKTHAEFLDLNRDVNSKIKVSQDERQLKEITDRLDTSMLEKYDHLKEYRNMPFNEMHLQHYSLLKFKMQATDDKQVRDLHCFLFDELFLMTQKSKENTFQTRVWEARIGNHKFTYYPIINIADNDLRIREDKGNPLNFFIIVDNEAGTAPQMFNFTTITKDDRKEWIRLLNDAKDRLRPRRPGSIRGRGSHKQRSGEKERSKERERSTETAAAAAAVYSPELLISSFAERSAESVLEYAENLDRTEVLEVLKTTMAMHLENNEVKRKLLSMVNVLYHKEGSRVDSTEAENTADNT